MTEKPKPEGPYEWASRVHRELNESIQQLDRQLADLTPEMVEAGFDALTSFDSRDYPSRAMVMAVFDAMLAALPRPTLGSHDAITAARKTIEAGGQHDGQVLRMDGRHVGRGQQIDRATYAGGERGRADHHLQR